MWNRTCSPGVGGASAQVAGARGEYVVLASADPAPDVRAVATPHARVAPAGAPRRSARARVGAAGASRARWLPLSASAAFHLLLFALSAWLSARSIPDRPPELVFQVTVPSLESAEHEEAPPPDTADPLEEPVTEPTDPTPETALVVEADRGDPPPPEPEEPVEALPAEPTFEPAPGFGPPPARVRLRPEPTPASSPGPAAAASSAVPAPARPAAPAAPASVASRAQSAVERASGLSGNRPPAYPADARQRGEQGTVRLEIELDADGIVTSVRVLRSSGSMALDEAARAAAVAWRFRPARRDGGAVRAVLERNITFLLRE